MLNSGREWLGTALLASVLVFSVSGCSKNNVSAKSADPAMMATLNELTSQLHHTMVGRKINRDFDEFVALSKVEVPPPPPGTKYAINEKWKVVLVDN